MDCNSFRNTDEYPGSVEYTGDKTVQSVGIDRMGAADGVSGLCGSMVKLGPAQATMLIVIAQLVVSYLIEMFGLFGVEKQPFEWKKLAGTAIVVAGIVLFKWE